MPQESLLTLVEKLRKQIDNHGPTLRQNEALTRYVLIDPLLRELGWDTENATLVIPEYTGVGGSAYYALFSGDKPLMIVEAKKLDTSLQGKVIRQGIGYCQEQGTLYFSVTDGRRWEVYETHKPVPIDEKRIVAFDLKSQSAAEACLKALTLWQIRVSGQVATGQIPIVGPTHNQPDSPKSPPPQPTPPSLEWQPLSKLNQRPHDPPPAEIQFPDNSAIPVTTWKALLVEVAKWLDENKLLTEDHCPITIPGEPWRTTWYVAHTKAVHSNGQPFRDSTRVGSFYIANNSGKAAASAIRIIEHVGQDPAQFKVRFSPPRTQSAPS